MIIVRKVRGQNKLKPVILSPIDVKLIKRHGLRVEEFVKDYVRMIAKKRRWKWYFEKEKGTLES